MGWGLGGGVGGKLLCPKKNTKNVELQGYIMCVRLGNSLLNKLIFKGHSLLNKLIFKGNSLLNKLIFKRHFLTK